MTQQELARQAHTSQARFPCWNQERTEAPVWHFCDVSELFWESSYMLTDRKVITIPEPHQIENSIKSKR